jgi:HSP20 family protein
MVDGEEVPVVREDRDIAKRPYDIWTNLDRIFEQFRSSVDDLFWPFRHRVAPSVDGRIPLTDIADLGDKYEAEMELPGIPKEAINIEVRANNVEISAKHEESREDQNKNWLRRERSTMSFYRNFELPEEIKTDAVEAELKNGMLKIILPKVKPKPVQKATKVKVK